MMEIERFFSPLAPQAVRVWFAHLPVLSRFWAAHTTLSNFSIAFTIYFCIAYACGALMAKKGRNYVLGFLVAFFVPVLGVLIIACYPSKHARKVTRDPRKLSKHGYGHDDQISVHAKRAASLVEGPTCPFCSIRLAQDARVCRVCQFSIEQHSAEAVA
jgi:hypothetical protein